MMESTRAITEMVLQDAKESAEDIIQEAKESAEDALEKQRQLGVQRGNELAQSLLKKAQREAEVEVLLNEKDSALSLKLDKLAKEISEKTGFETKLRLSEEKPKVIGGAMVRTNNGTVIMDNTFDDILGRREKDLRSKIAKILFK